MKFVEENIDVDTYKGEHKGVKYQAYVNKVKLGRDNWRVDIIDSNSDFIALFLIHLSCSPKELEELAINFIDMHHLNASICTTVVDK